MRRFLFFVILGCVFMVTQKAHAAAPSLVQYHDCMDEIDGGAGTASGRSGEYVVCRFPQPTLGGTGDCIVGGFMNDASSAVYTPTDDASNSYTVKSYEDTANTEALALFYSINDTSANYVTLTNSASDPLRIPWIAEFTNCGGLDVASEGNHGTSTTATAGSATPAVTGDLVIDEMDADYQSPKTVTMTPTVGSQTNITWALLAASRAALGAVQWGVYTSTSALNPSMTYSVAGAGNTNGFVSIAIFLKPASSGPGIPAGPWIYGMKDSWITNDGSGSTAFYTSPRTDNFPCPSTATMGYVGWIGATEGSDTLTAATLNGTSLTQTGAAYNGAADSISHNYYGVGLMMTTNQTLVLTGNFVSPSTIEYCVGGLSTFAQTETGSGSQSSTTGTLTATPAPLLTTTGASGLIFTQTGVSLNTVYGALSSTGLTCYAHTGLDSGENANIQGINQNNGWGVCKFSSSSTSVTPVWMQYKSSTASNAFVDRADEFDASAVLKPATPKNLSGSVVPQ
ncbi:MAG: hypothetical protein WCC14_18835 [Acidobacteriaceae bacterium]